MPASKAELQEQAAHAQAVKDFMSYEWPALEAKGFSVNWGRNRLGDWHKSFLLPCKDKFVHLKDCKLIEVR